MRLSRNTGVPYRLTNKRIATNGSTDLVYQTGRGIYPLLTLRIPQTSNL